MINSLSASQVKLAKRWSQNKVLRRWGRLADLRGRRSRFFMLRPSALASLPCAHDRLESRAVPSHTGRWKGVRTCF